GLNPHASDNGLLGKEEAEIIDKLLKSRHAILKEWPKSEKIIFAEYLVPDVVHELIGRQLLNVVLIEPGELRKVKDRSTQ
ncbi:MAG: hypothetical protein EOP09_18330, partial [Proteobacteria bacterium]